ncbi:sulfhydryl oxidase [Achlya hypogyna]|uniref:Sulfhydryl oxidase n=1 Tax=Achlya hypogyna TaxID=1202772 RepID=A0A1V9YLU4_ACHHY|nr:sulfhydryl oxidase [Achlya hypogyna]
MAPVMAFWGNSEPLFTDSFNIESFTDETFDATVLSSSTPWVVDFYAPWCPHCRHFAPHYEAVADHYGESTAVHFGAIDCTKYGPICNRYDILGYPALRLFQIEADPIKMPFSPRPKSFQTVVTWIEETMTEKNRSTSVALPDFSTFKLDDHKKALRGPKAEAKKKTEAIDARANRLRDAAHALVFSFETSFFMGAEPLVGTRYAAARSWLQLLTKRFPLAANQKQLAELLYRFESQASWTADEWRLLVALWKSDSHGRAYPKDLFTRPNYVECETFTCGVWLLLHALAASDGDVAPLGVATGVRSFVEHFFGCELCRMHFLEANPISKLETLLGDPATAKDALVLWLYHMHNTVNVRVGHPVWPAKAECKLCYKTDVASANRTDVAEAAVLKYMTQAYAFPATDADVDRPVAANDVAMGADGTALKGASAWEAYTPSTPLEIAPFLLIATVFFVVYRRRTISHAIVNKDS